MLEAGISAPKARRSPSVIESTETLDVENLEHRKKGTEGYDDLLSDFPHENSVLCVLSPNPPYEKSCDRKQKSPENQKSSDTLGFFNSKIYLSMFKPTNLQRTQLNLDGRAY